MNTILDDLERP